MICVETIGKIRRWHRVDKLSISKIAKRLSASRNTIAKYLDGEEITVLFDEVGYRTLSLPAVVGNDLLVARPA